MDPGAARRRALSRNLNDLRRRRTGTFGHAPLPLTRVTFDVARLAFKNCERDA